MLVGGRDKGTQRLNGPLRRVLRVVVEGPEPKKTLAARAGPHDNGA